VVIGLLMHFIYRKEEAAKVKAAAMPADDDGRPLWQTALYFASMIAILVFANWGKPSNAEGIWQAVYSLKWILTGLGAAGLGLMLIFWFRVQAWKLALAAAASLVFALLLPEQPMAAFAAGVVGLSVITATQKGEMEDWFGNSLFFAKQIMPILFAGVIVAGLLLGRPGHDGLIPSVWVSTAVGGNSLSANFFASIAGALMYFATLTEVPILQGLIGSGMGKGPALALLLAGPAVSLPNMLVIRSIIGTKKTATYIILVIIMATISGMLYGTFF
jgi:uncharacterized membrane protein YraQ (UPF0718 family)